MNRMMKDLSATALSYRQGKLYILDQRKLPGEEDWHACTSTDELIALIRGLAIRGAPLIGIAATLWIGHCASQGCSSDELGNIIARLRDSRPTAVNLGWAVERMLTVEFPGASANLAGCRRRRTLAG